MEVRCTRNCKKKDKQGRCLAEAISTKRLAAERLSEFREFEPFRADNVVIYDKAGIPSVMVRFSRVTDNDLFGGSCDLILRLWWMGKCMMKSTSASIRIQ